MLSPRTCVELAYTVENFSIEEIDRIFHVFNLTFLIFPRDRTLTKSKKIDCLLDFLKDNKRKGPFTDYFQLDLLQYVIDNYYRRKQKEVKHYIKFNNSYTEEVPYDDLFSRAHEPLANSLKRDGFYVKERTIKKLLPEEIEEAKTENELELLLDKFNFSVAKGHLTQARNNHSLGNWAGANSQFRPFIESLFIELAKLLSPTATCDSAYSAIIALGQEVSPPFLRSDLNEIENSKCKKPFIDGLWKRLHPEGNHPGLSDEEDSTFRYHIVIVFAHYLLKRLEKRIATKST